MRNIDFIETNNLEKKFYGESLIRYKNMRFEKGKPCMILGASGCGKSTLLNMIAGLTEPTSGRIDCVTARDTIAEMNIWDVWNRTPKERDKFRIENVGYIYQDFKLIEDMSVKDNIDILGIESVDTSRADDLLKNLGIYEYLKKRVKYLSGGQKQRVAIARALVKNPPIVLADEPTGNLNYEIGEQVVKDLVDYSRDKILIVVSHDTRLSKYFDIIEKM